MAHTTFHGKAGKFSSPTSAHTVTKKGERFKVVRQHRRMKPKGPAIKAKPKSRAAKETIETAARSRDRVAAISLIDGVPYVSMRELLGG